MDQGPTVPPVTAETARRDAPHVAEQVAAVDAARRRLGNDLDNLTREIRTEMSETTEKLAFKATTALVAVVAGIVVKKVLGTVWAKARGSEPPDGADTDSGLGDVLGWAAATAAGLAVVKVLAERGTAKGWEKALGHAPPR